VGRGPGCAEAPGRGRGHGVCGGEGGRTRCLLPCSTYYLVMTQHDASQAARGCGHAPKQTHNSPHCSARAQLTKQSPHYYDILDKVHQTTPLKNVQSRPWDENSWYPWYKRPWYLVDIRSISAAVIFGQIMAVFRDFSSFFNSLTTVYWYLANIWVYPAHIS